MKIQNINNNYYCKIKNTQKNNTPIALYKSDSINLSSKKQISFGGLQELQLKLEARALEKEADTACKVALQMHDDSHSILLDASEFQEEANYIRNNAPRILKRAIAIYNHGKANNFEAMTDKNTGELLRQYYDGDDGQFVIEDHGEKEKTIRKIIFDKNVIMVMELNSQTGKMDAFTFDTQTKDLVQYAKDIKIDVNGYSAQKVFNYSFENGELSSCDLKYKMVEDGFEKAQKHYNYQNGKLTEFYNDWLLRENTSLNCGECFVFDDVQLQQVSVGLDKEFDKHIKSQQEYLFCEDGYLSTYIKGLSMPVNQNSSMKAMHKFGDEGLQKIYVNVGSSVRDKKTSAQKLFLFGINSPTRCRLDYEITSDGKESHSKVITLEK